MKELAHRLAHELDWDEKEAAGYVHLLVKGTMKAADFTQSLKIGRGEAHRLLEKLLQRGVVTKTPTTPAEFSAIPPEHVWDDAIQVAGGRVESLKGARRAFLGHLEKRRAIPASTAKPTTQVLIGRREVTNVVRRSLLGAASVCIVRTAKTGAVRVPPPTREVEQVRSLLARRLDEGMELRCVQTFPDEDAMRAAAPLLAHPRVSLKHLATAEPINFMVIDGREAFLALALDEENSPHGASDVVEWTTYPALVRAKHAIFAGLSALAVDVRATVGMDIPLERPGAAAVQQGGLGTETLAHELLRVTAGGQAIVQSS